MNYSDKYKTVWWGPMRTGSRAVGCIMRHFEFYNATNNKPLSDTAHTHDFGFPEGKGSYKLICSVRNPYARMTSLYSHAKITLKIQDRFEFFIEKILYEKPEYVFFEKKLPKHHTIIHLENLKDDLLSLQMISESNIQSHCDWKRYILNNSFERQHLDAPVYNKSLANIIYTNFQMQFELFGYSKESYER